MTLKQTKSKIEKLRKKLPKFGDFDSQTSIIFNEIDTLNRIKKLLLEIESEKKLLKFK